MIDHMIIGYRPVKSSLSARNHGFIDQELL